MSARFPAIAAEWHPRKNGELSPDQVLPGSDVKVWWRCAKERSHEWETSVVKRTRRGHGCPFCGRKRVTKANSLAATHPHLAREWDRGRNGRLSPTDVVSGSNRVVWWICSEDPTHQFKQRITDRASTGIGCPKCGHRVVSQTTSLAARFPGVVWSWHPTLNGALRPTQVLSQANRKVWWRCPKSPRHVWEADIRSRTASTRNGCPFCRGYRLHPEESFAAMYPDLMKEWHPTLNEGVDPAQIRADSHRIARWLCPEGHSWTIRLRLRPGRSCPHCAKIAKA
ncbi:MAG: zinc-ribbon domain-containing protein [Polyangiaceae bacterium]|nr:zinc-ribbon domain-containing protein [Polyangiaceae bacterium]